MNPTTAVFTLETRALKAGAAVLRALRNPLRQKIIKEIHRSKSVKVSDLYFKLQLEQSLVSAHLGILRGAGFVHSEKKGREVYYSLNYSRFVAVHQLLHELRN